MNDPWRCAARADPGARCAGLRFKSKAVSSRWPRRPRYGSPRARAMGDGCRDVVRADRSYGRSLPRCCSCRPELWEIALRMLLTSSGALPGTIGRWLVALGTLLVQDRSTLHTQKSTRM